MPATELGGPHEAGAAVAVPSRSPLAGPLLRPSAHPPFTWQTSSPLQTHLKACLCQRGPSWRGWPLRSSLSKCPWLPQHGGRAHWLRSQNTQPGILLPGSSIPKFSNCQLLAVLAEPRLVCEMGFLTGPTLRKVARRLPGAGAREVLVPVSSTEGDATRLPSKAPLKAGRAWGPNAPHRA